MATTPTPDPELQVSQHLQLKVNGGPTEMGFRVDVHSRQINLMIELDLDYDPEFTYALLQVMPQIIETQMEQYTKQEDDT